jgi:hypothetical protein
MLTIPVTQETSIPIIKLTVITDGSEITCGSLTMAAPRMMGVDNRNENRAAPSLVIPVSSPVVIVMPERETPGMIANPCDIPMSILVLKVILFIPIFLALLQSAQYRRTPIPINMMAMRAGDRKMVSAFLSSRNPAAAPGTLAAAKYQNNLPLALRTSVKPFIMSCHQSLQK